MTTLSPYRATYVERVASLELLLHALADAVIYKVISRGKGVFDLNMVFVCDVHTHVLQVQLRAFLEEVGEHVSGVEDMSDTQLLEDIGILSVELVAQVHPSCQYLRRVGLSE